jgi:hypothetical protein
MVRAGRWCECAVAPCVGSPREAVVKGTIVKVERNRGSDGEEEQTEEGERETL